MNNKQIFSKKTVRDIDLKDKRIVLRIDWDVPGDDKGNVTDDYRIRMSIPTIQYLLDQNCAITLLSKRGRPKNNEDKLSLRNVANKASELLGLDVKFVEFTVGPEAEEAVKNLQNGEILLLENLRFNDADKPGDGVFAKQLASYGDVYVDDAFAMVHRLEASVLEITKYLPAVAGLLVEREVTTILAAIENPQQPLVAITGGSKLETKLPLLENFMKIADQIVIAGVMANTMLVAQGKSVGKSIYDEHELGMAKKMLVKAKETDTKLLLPLQDVAVGSSVDASNRREVATSAVGPDDLILDFGQASIKMVLDAITPAKTIIWNGPLGYFENPVFAEGSNRVAEAIARSDATSIVGGGDTGDVVNSLNLADKFTHVSTGGGASLELMAGNTLPGVEALLDK